MQCPPVKPDEVDRLRALADYGIVPGKPIRSLDRIVDIAAKIFDLPMAAVNFIGRDETFISSQVGFGDVCGSSRDISFCGHAIAQDGIMVVNDALQDQRFHDNPLVLDGIIRFYAGAPIRSSSGHALGALCVVDTRAHHEYGHENIAQLGHLAKIVEDELELHRLHGVEAGQSSQLAMVAEMSPNAVICFDEAGLVTVWNAAASTMFGRPAASVLGHSVDTLVAEEDRERVHVALRRVLDGGTPGNIGIELTGLRQSGEPFPMELFWSSWGEGEHRRFGAIVKDLTERNREREALHHLTNYDPLTGLPNRHLMQRHVVQAVAERLPMAFLAVDLIGLADVNSTIDQAAGETLLRIVSDRIKAAAPARSIIGRLSFEQFAVLVLDAQAATNAEYVARHIRSIISAPIKLDSGEEIKIDSCFGIATAPDDGERADKIMANADLALLQARQIRGICTFTPELRSAAIERRKFDIELHHALEKGEFRLFYQPQIDLASGALVGSEALIRWHHPSRGLLPPSAFLSQIESGDLAVPVGEWVLETACAQLASWRRRQTDLRISVNLFSAQFRNGTLPAVVMDVLTKHGLPADALELEITENIVLDEDLRILPQLKALREAGVSLSFDDFGTGFASLNMLRDYPITAIKIDKSFTQALTTSASDRAIVRSIVGLAHELGLGVVAEGIETEAEIDFLAALNCDKVQGYFYGKPMPADVFQHQCFEPRH